MLIKTFKRVTVGKKKKQLITMETIVIHYYKFARKSVFV